jgi:four helix bundle protein
MGKIKEFTDLLAWQEAHKLVLQVYKTTSNFPEDERYGLISQLRRAVTSITANIAEGFSRWHYKDRVNFYYNARGSLSEVKNFLITTRDLKIITIDSFSEIYEQSKRAEMFLNGLIKSTREREQ